MSKILTRTFKIHKIATKLNKFQILTIRSNKTCPPQSSPSGCSKSSKNYATMDDLPFPFGWFAGQHLVINSNYNRYLSFGLLLMVGSIYKFQTDHKIKQLWTNRQYICDFDYDMDYKGVMEADKYPLDDV